MNSKEIAELTGKKPFHVLRDIRKMFNEGDLDINVCTYTGRVSSINLTEEQRDALLIKYGTPVEGKQVIHCKRKELQLGDLLQSALGDIEILPQFSILGYRLDFYLPDYDLAVEYDEEHHSCQLRDDAIRQHKVEKVLGCTFIRIKEGCEGKGLIEVYSFINKC